MTKDELVEALLQAAKGADEAEALIAELRDQQDLLDHAVSSNGGALDAYNTALGLAA